MKTYLFILAAMCMLSCGHERSSEDGDEFSPIYDAGAFGGEEPVVGEGLDADVALFKGYVSNGFEVTVNGETFRDLEDFYTAELGKLPAKAVEAGYAGYSAVFEAEIGFKDLWKGMDIYLAPEEDKGYQGQSSVGVDGGFEVELPAEGLEESYKVRANKRISLILEKDGERVTLCYNFSALEKSVLLSERDKPIILKDFESHLTAYACEMKAEKTELEIPDAAEGGDTEEAVESPAKAAVGASHKMKPGDTKAVVLAAYGSGGLVLDDGRWCYGRVSNVVNKLCAVSYANTCTCYLDFDESGGLVEHHNIKSEYLDILAW